MFTAKSCFIKFSPYKLRPLVDVVRGKSVLYALNFLDVSSLKKAVPVRKVIASAAANAKNISNMEAVNLFIKDIRVDEGPRFGYFKPGAMGRSNVYRKRLSHISVTLESSEGRFKQ